MNSLLTVFSLKQESLVFRLCKKELLCILTSSSCCHAAGCCASRRSAALPALLKSCLGCLWSGHQRSLPKPSLSNTNGNPIKNLSQHFGVARNTFWGPWCTCSLLLPRVTVTVHPQHVVRDLTVLLGIHLVQHDEEEVETWQQGILEADVIHGGFILVVLEQKKKEKKERTLEPPRAPGGSQQNGCPFERSPCRRPG